MLLRQKAGELGGLCRYVIDAGISLRAATSIFGQPSGMIIEVRVEGRFC